MNLVPEFPIRISNTTTKCAESLRRLFKICEKKKKKKKRKKLHRIKTETEIKRKKTKLWSGHDRRQMRAMIDSIDVEVAVDAVELTKTIKTILFLCFFFFVVHSTVIRWDPQCLNVVMDGLMRRMDGVPFRNIIDLSDGHTYSPNRTSEPRVRRRVNKWKK